MTNYQDFVKTNYHKLPANLSATERMSALAKLWRSHNGTTKPTKKVSKGGDLTNDLTDANGSGFFSDLGNGIDAVSSLFGFGLEKPKKKPGRPRKSVKGGELNENESGSGFMDDMMHLGGGNLANPSADQMISEQGGKLHKRVSKKQQQQHDLNNNELFALISKKQKEHQARGSGFDLSSILKTVSPILPFFL